MPPKPKADTSALKALKARLRMGEADSLYLFYGEEAYLRDHYLGELKKTLLPAGMEEFNLRQLSGKDLTPIDIVRAVDCLPMMSGRTLVIVSDYDLYKTSEDHRKELLDLFADLPDYVCLVFVYDLIDYKPDGRSKLAAALKGHVVQFPRQEQGDLTDWIRRRFRALGKDIDGEQARYLMFLCGDLMTTLASEIAKIGAYATHTRVTREDIDAVAAPQLDAVVFQMTDAIALGNYDKAASVLGDLFHQQESPIMLLAVLGKHLRQLYSARLGLENGKGADWLAGLWKMHPYPAEKLMAAARKLDLAWCRRAVTRAAETDLAMKSGGDPKGQLVGLLLELANG